MLTPAPKGSNSVGSGMPSEKKSLILDIGIQVPLKIQFFTKNGKIECAIINMNAPMSDRMGIGDTEGRIFEPDHSGGWKPSEKKILFVMIHRVKSYHYAYDGAKWYYEFLIIGMDVFRWYPGNGERDSALEEQLSHYNASVYDLRFPHYREESMKVREPFKEPTEPTEPEAPVPEND
jgi:hypothetical protein